LRSRSGRDRCGLAAIPALELPKGGNQMSGATEPVTRQPAQPNDLPSGRRGGDRPLVGVFLVGVVGLYVASGYVVYRAISALV
jgi:hypothetical protein